MNKATILKGIVLVPTVVWASAWVTSDTPLSVEKAQASARDLLRRFGAIR